VRAYVTVTRAGAPVGDLPCSAFDVRDNGKPVVLTTCAGPSQPATLITLFDRSAMNDVGHAAMTDAVSALGSALRPGDWAHFGNLNGVGRSLTHGRGQQPLGQIWNSADASIWDVLDHTISAIADEPPHRAILVFTGRSRPPSEFGSDWTSSGQPVHFHGRSNPADTMGMGASTEPAPPKSVVNVHDVALDAARQSVIVYAVAYAQRVYESDVKSVATDSGGAFYSLAPKGHLGAVFAAVATELHAQYLVTFVPAVGDGKVHTLEVKLKNAHGATARAPKTFFAAKRP
jgi:hypothetical protein